MHFIPIVYAGAFALILKEVNEVCVTFTKVVDIYELVTPEREPGRKNATKNMLVAFNVGI